MSTGYSVAFANTMLDALRGITFANSGTTIGLHCGDPGPDGTAHVSAGAPARIPIAFAPAAGGVLTLAATPTWINTGGVTETISHISVFNDAGSFLWSAQLNPREWIPGDSTTVSSMSLAMGPLAA